MNISFMGSNAMKATTWRMMFAALALWAATACVPGGPPDDPVMDAPADSSDSSTPVETTADSMPDFAVPDVNPASPRFSQDVSPRDYLGQISAWYFGHST